jgi:hypothetical protein
MNYVDLVRTIVTGALLLGFLIVYAQEALLIWRKQKPLENDARTYIWTAISVLVGSVTAFSMGVKFPDQAVLLSVLSPEKWRAIYAGFYTITGLFAVVTWAIRTGWTSALMKNLATTFLGIAVPVVSAWLIVVPSVIKR